MAGERDTLATQYRSALEDYFHGAGERALERAYEIGRKVMAASLGVLDLARIHQESLTARLALTSGADSVNTVIRQASEFFAEALSPFEMTHRGFQEAIVSLRKSNETLEHQVTLRTAALSRTQDLYRLITEHSRDLVYVLDLEGQFVYASPSFRHVLGYAFEDLIGISCLVLIHPDDQNRVSEVYRRALFSPEGLSVEFRYMHKDGRYVPFESVWNWVLNEDGSPQRVVVASRDISERKKSEEQLRASELRYRRLFESAREGILLLDADTLMVRDVNPFVLDLLRLEEKAVCGMPLTAVAELQPVADTLHQLLTDGREDRSTGSREMRLQRSSGEKIDVELMANRFYLGRHPVVQCIIHDISVRKRYERRQTAQYETTRILSEASVVSETMPKLLEGICRNLQWELAALWGVDRHTNVLRCLELWHAPERDDTRFVTESRSRTFRSGEGLPGTVWATGEPVWMPDIMAANILRHPVEDATPLHGGFGFPIRLGNDIIGVIECFSREIQPIDEDLLAVMSIIGSQIGQFLERKYTEESLRESEEQYRTVAETASDAIITVDEYSTIQFANTAAEQIFGYGPRELLGKSLTVIMPEFLRVAFTASVRDYLQTGKKHTAWQGLEMPGLHRSGRHIPLEISYGETVRDGRRYFIGIARDITDRKRAEESVRRSKEQLRNLSARLQTVREEERRWIAREIHDELGQALTGIKMYLSWMHSKVGGTEGSEFAPLLLAKMTAMSSLIDTTIESIQRIVAELRPGVLDDLGLLAAIEWQAQEFENRAGIRCEVDARIRDVQFDDQRSTAIFRIFQETLTNVARHAQASLVSVRLEEIDGKLHLEVHDNGKGIREEDISASRSLGLLGIRERASIFGGDVEFAGSPQAGTTVSVVIPLKDEAGDAAAGVGRAAIQQVQRRN